MPLRLRSLTRLPGDQEARDDEEDVDADESAGQAHKPGVERHDKEDGDSPEPLDLGAEGVASPSPGLCIHAIHRARP